MKKGDIVTVIAMTGEYVGRLDKIEGSNVVLKDPKLIVKGEDGGIGFGRGVCMSAEENVGEVAFMGAVFVAPSNERFQSAFIEATSGLVV
jgi:hypothetical protein